jgi:hypothetical protein
VSRHTDGGRVVEAEPFEQWADRVALMDRDWWWRTHLFLVRERISRYGLSTGPGEREGCTALDTFDNRPGRILSDGTEEMEALKDAVDGPELPGPYKSELPVKRARKNRKK